MDVVYREKRVSRKGKARKGNKERYILYYSEGNLYGLARVVYVIFLGTQSSIAVVIHINIIPGVG